MSGREDTGHLLDIVRAARLIQQFAAAIDRQEFERSPLHQSAILHQFLVLGEATKRLSPSFKGQFADMPWPEVAGMRDRLIHGYADVNLDVVWDTAVQDIPALLDRLDPLIPSREED